VHVVDLVLFIFVAVITGHVAASLRRAKMREQADALREAVIGSVSHELRSLLSAILGSASVLGKAPEILKDARLGPLVSGLHEEAERLNDLIQDLLDASRISSEGIQPHAEWVDPGDIVNAAVERRVRLLASHQLKLVVADNLPLIYVDSILIERALGHLIENAVKFSAPSSPIEISAGWVDRMIKFAVRDEGVGLSADERDHIWERLYRSPRHTAIGGSGLGLWIARALVTACGGEVDAFSAGVGRGTTLSIHLPVPPRADYEQLRSPDEESPADRASH
jgi:two-component system sensor histidine kinase KdpD